MLKTVLDNLDDVPEAIRGEYKEQKVGDKTVFVLDLDGVDAHPGVINLKSAHERTKADKKKLGDDLAAAKSKLSTVPDDFDADEWDRLRTEDAARVNDPDGKDVRKQVETAVSAVKAQYETKVTKLKNDHASEIAGKDKVIGELTGDIQKRLVGDGLTTALTEAGITNPSFLKAARAMLESGVEVLVEDGVRVARMKSEFGGDEIAKYVANWVQGDEGKVFVTPAKGADAGGSKTRTAGEANPFTKESWNVTAQGRLQSNDRAKAERMAKSAGYSSLDAANKAMRPLA